MRSWILTLLFIPVGVCAQISTDRPDFTESPLVVPKGALQLETGFSWESTVRDHCLAEYHRNTTFNTTLLRFGLSERTELRLNWSIDQQHSEARLERIPVAPCIPEEGQFDRDTSIRHLGLSPVFIGFKHNLLSTDRLAIGFLAHLYVPYASAEFAAERFAPEFLVPIGISVTDRFSVSTQLGMSWDGIGLHPTGWVTLSMAYAVSDALGVYVEPLAFLDHERALHKVNGGLTYLFNDRFQWDCSAGVWDDHQANRHPNYFLSTGISYIWP